MRVFIMTVFLFAPIACISQKTADDFEIPNRANQIIVHSAYEVDEVSDALERNGFEVTRVALGYIIAEKQITRGTLTGKLITTIHLSDKTVISGDIEGLNATHSNVRSKAEWRGGRRGSLKMSFADMVDFALALSSPEEISFE